MIHICQANDCSVQSHRRVYCDKHTYRFKKYGTPYITVHNRRHGLSNTKVYRAWSNMLSRCNNQNHRAYSNYGGRGIRVCKRWQVFENFLADMGMPPTPKHSLDRINDNGNYSPSNCRWADVITQNNNKRTNRRIAINGVTRTVTEWSRELNLTPFKVTKMTIGGDGK